jgi:hypothetical protein
VTYILDIRLVLIRGRENVFDDGVLPSCDMGMQKRFALQLRVHNLQISRRMSMSDV